MKIAAALVLISFAALAEEAKTEAKKMSPEEQAMMDKYMKAATPGPEHQQLAKLAGRWKMQTTAWMAPGASLRSNERIRSRRRSRPPGRIMALIRWSATAFQKSGRWCRVNSLTIRS